MTAIDQASIARPASANPRLVAAAAFALPPVMLAAVACGLALRGGGVAPEQWQPAALGLAASLVVLAAVGAVPRVERAALPMLAGLAGLLLWSAASFAWTASREATFEHVIRLGMLAAAAVVGIAYAARPRAALLLAASLALAGAVAAVAIEVKLLTGDTDAYLGSRLSWPINYANADAALVWLPLPALLAFAAARRLRPLVRGTFGLLTALALAVGLSAQSRGAAIALVGALIASVAIARDRSELLLTMFAIVAPVAAVAPRMVGGDVSTTIVRDRGQAALIASFLGAAFVCCLAMLSRRGRFPFDGRQARMAFITWVVALALAAGVLLTASGRPDEWASARWNEFTNLDPAASVSNSDASHFGTGASNRYDYWRVAWHTFKDLPIQGTGAGAFSVPWFRSRSIDGNVTDAHSWEASALAETGFVGLMFTAAALFFPLTRIRRVRVNSVWPIAPLALGGAAVYFVLHASVDWLLRIPAIALPGFVVLGALAGARPPGGGLAFAGPAQRTALAAAAVVVVALATPAYLSIAAVSRAETEAATSTKDALDELKSAARLNPFSTEPLLIRSTLLLLGGESKGAVGAATEATERSPENWASWLVLAEARRSAGERSGEREALDRAAGLNPRALQLVDGS